MFSASTGVSSNAELVLYAPGAFAVAVEDVCFFSSSACLFFCSSISDKLAAIAAFKSSSSSSSCLLLLLLAPFGCGVFFCN